MNYISRGYDINKTFIIEPLAASADTTPIVSACTAVYTNAVLSCSGDTQIFLENGLITFNGNLYTNDNLSANTINASTYLSGGTNIFDIISLNNITGGTFNNNTDTLTLFKQNNTTINITGFTDYYTTGATLIGNTVYFDRNNELSAYTLSLSAFSTVDTYVTGVTFNNNLLAITRNDGVILNTLINNFSGLTVNGLLRVNTISATTISATTFFGDGSNLTGISTQDTFLTGGTYNPTVGVATFVNNTGGTFTVNGFNTGYTLTSSAITSTLGYTPLSAYTDTFPTGLTYNPSNYNLVLANNNGTLLSTNLFTLASDITITGGTYNPTTGVATFVNNTGGTFNISGFLTGFTDVILTGGSYNYETKILRLNNSDNSFVNISGFTDTFLTGGTYNPTIGVATFVNNTGGTFNVNGFSISSTNVIVTGFSYDNLNTLSISNSTGGTLNASINNIKLQNVSATTISATTYLNLPTNVNTFITGGTYSNGITTLIDNSGNTILISGYYTGFTGGLVSGLTATTISATTYLGLPIDVRVTGGTYNPTVGVATFINNTGGTFTVNGFNTGYTLTSSAITSTLGYTPLSAVTEYWINGSSGNFSLITKNDSGLDATGDYSLAEGSGTLASGDLSHAEGDKTTSEGIASHAEGNFTIASGNYSHAEGQQTTANSDAAHSEGYLTIALNKYTHAEGAFSVASGETSHAEGQATTAGNSSAHAEGYFTIALGQYSHSEGEQTTASGQTSHAEGRSTIAGGSASHAEGIATNAIGDYSHAEGRITTSIGLASHSEGRNTTAIGLASHSEGDSSTALGDYSHAGGIASVASGLNSFVHGSGSTASGQGTIVLGDELSGSSPNTVFVNSLNIKNIPTNSSINNLGIDVNGNVVIGNSGGGGGGNTFSGTTSIDFGLFENSFTSVFVPDINVRTNSSIIFDFRPSIDHETIEDFLLDGIFIKAGNINNGVGFDINAYALNNTWGEYNIFYKIIN
jgi:hypothetical protein